MVSGSKARSSRAGYGDHLKSERAAKAPPSQASDTSFCQARLYSTSLTKKLGRTSWPEPNPDGMWPTRRGFLNCGPRGIP